MARGKSKGSKFERDISKQMSKWLSGKEKPYCFWRTHASGAIMTMDECNTHFAGDIMSISTEAHKVMEKIVIECKVGYNQISLDKFFKNNKNDLLRDFWDQCIEEAKGTNREPFLIYKKSGLPTVVMFKKKLVNKLNKDLLAINNISISWEGYEDVIMYDFQTFLEMVKPKQIINL